MSSIATPYEIAVAFPQHGSNDPSLVQSQLDLVEATLFTQQLGLDFKANLVASLSTHTFTEYNSTATYAVGDKVRSQGLIYECIQNANSGTGIFNTDYWRLALKFSEAEYEHIWRNFLLNAIAYKVMAQVMQYRTVRPTDKGLQISRTEFSSAPDYRIMKDTISRYNKDGDNWLLLMDSYIRGDTKRDLTVFSNYQPLKKDAELPARSRRRRRRHGFLIEPRVD